MQAFLDQGGLLFFAIATCPAGLRGKDEAIQREICAPSSTTREGGSEK